MADTAVAAVARLLDGVRAPVLRVAIAHSPHLRRAVRSRAYRLELLAAIGVVGALIAVVLAPALVFLWGPLLLGVPHLVADVRYLVLPRYAPVGVRARDLLLAVPLVATIVMPSPLLGGSAVLVAIALTPTGRSRRAAIVMTAAVGLCVAAACWPEAALYGLLHAHNAIAIVIAGVILVGGRAGAILVVTAAAGAALILSGAIDPLIRTMPLDGVVRTVLPDSALSTWSTAICARIGLAFIFLQSVHYAAWLRLVPEALRPRPGMRGFAGALRALESDLGRRVVVAVVVLAVGLIVAGTVDAHWARNAYLGVAGFHAYLELAVLARWLVGARTR